MNTQVIAALAVCLFVTVLCPAIGYACLLCDSSQAVEVRAGLVDELTPTTLAAVTLPFLIVAGVISAIHFGLPQGRNTR